jgi:hypothetical protein
MHAIQFLLHWSNGKKQREAGTYLKFSLELLFLAEARDFGVPPGRRIPRVGGREVCFVFCIGFEKLHIGGVEDVVRIKQFEERLVVLPC